jgi:septal ring factor EnvC (AmiA/AmiB activator)
VKRFFIAGDRDGHGKLDTLGAPDELDRADRLDKLDKLDKLARAPAGRTQGSRRRRQTAFVRCCLLAVPVLLLAQQPDRARTEALARRAGDRLQSLQREADRLASEERTLLGDLRRLEIDRQIKAEQLQRAAADVSKVQGDLDATTERIEHLQQQDRAERPDLDARLVETYKLGRGRYLRLLLATSDLRRLGQATRAVAVMAKLDRDRIASHQLTLRELQSNRASLEARRKKVEALRAEAVRAQAAAVRAAQARNDLIRDIDRRRDLNAQLSGELQAAQQKLQVALRELGTGGAPVEVAALPLRPFRGDLDWPAAGPVRLRFNRTDGVRGPASHGIEIAAADGAPAQAIHGGVVAFADTFAGFGNLVILDHGSQTFSLYGNLLDLAVAKGARVEHGQTVGRVGPSPAGPAGLYFELRIDGQPVDPLQWLRKR